MLTTTFPNPDSLVNICRVKITFLGTGTSQGIPIIGCTCPVCISLDFKDKRLRTSVMVEQEGYRIAIDAGPDFRQQMLRERVTELNALLVTHEHRDHLAGLDDVRAFNYLNNQEMPVYAMPRVLDHIRKEFAYAFAEKKYPGVPRMELKEVGREPFQLGPLPIQPIPVMHYKLPVLGYRIGDFSYVTDSNYLSPAAMEIIKGSRVLVLNALQNEPHISHYTLQEAVQVAFQSGVAQVYFIHMSHKLGRHKEVNAELPHGMALAWDGLQVTL